MQRVKAAWLEGRQPRGARRAGVCKKWKKQWATPEVGGDHALEAVGLEEAARVLRREWFTTRGQRLGRMAPRHSARAGVCPKCMAARMHSAVTTRRPCTQTPAACRRLRPAPGAPPPPRASPPREQPGAAAHVHQHLAVRRLQVVHGQIVLLVGTREACRETARPRPTRF